MSPIGDDYRPSPATSARPVPTTPSYATSGGASRRRPLTAGARRSRTDLPAISQQNRARRSSAWRRARSLDCCDSRLDRRAIVAAPVRRCAVTGAATSMDTTLRCAMAAAARLHASRAGSWGEVCAWTQRALGATDTVPLPTWATASREELVRYLNAMLATALELASLACATGDVRRAIANALRASEYAYRRERETSTGQEFAGRWPTGDCVRDDGTLERGCACEHGGCPACLLRSGE